MISEFGLNDGRYTVTGADEKAARLTESIEKLFHQFMRHLHLHRGKLGSAASGLSLQQRKLIQFLARHGPRTMNDTSEHMLLAVSTMTGIADKMVAAGLIRRERSGEDRRVVRVSLTEEGMELYRIDIEERIRFSTMMLDSLSEDDQEIYVALTGKIIQSLSSRKPR